MKNDFAAIILAAGFSSRMDGFKPLLPFGAESVIERVVWLFRDAGIDTIRVVTGHKSTDLLPFLQVPGVRPVLNKRYREGMYTSVVAGIRSLEDFQGAFFLLPVDIPLVRLQTVITMMEAYGYGKRSLLYPAFHGRRGHPPLISTKYKDRIIFWSGQGGLKSLLAQYDFEAEEVEVPDKFILEDMDTPEDYRRLLAMWKQRDLPTFQECEMLLRNRFAAKKPLLDHSREVARLALVLAGELNKAGFSLDLKLIAAAALLHDLAKGRPDHAAEGARILVEIGYPEVAKIVAVHMDICLQSDGSINAGEIVYLADKMMQGDRYVPLEERCETRLKLYADNPEACRAVADRFKNAIIISERLESLLGGTLHKLLAENGFK